MLSFHFAVWLQQFDNLGMLSLNCELENARTLPFHASSSGNQNPACIRMAALYGEPERGFPVFAEGIDIAPFLNRRLYAINVALPRSFTKIHRSRFAYYVLIE
jgi:hypothetical protein